MRKAKRSVQGAEGLYEWWWGFVGACLLGQQLIGDLSRDVKEGVPHPQQNSFRHAHALAACYEEETSKGGGGGRRRILNFSGEPLPPSSSNLKHHRACVFLPVPVVTGGKHSQWITQKPFCVATPCWRSFGVCPPFADRPRDETAPTLHLSGAGAQNRAWGGVPKEGQRFIIVCLSDPHTLPGQSSWCVMKCPFA